MTQAPALAPTDPRRSHDPHRSLGTTRAAQAGPRPLGALAPLRSAIDAGSLALEAKLKGTLPSWLRGDLVRTAPAIFERRGEGTERFFRAQHWFDALGMMYGFRIDGGAVRFRQRLLESEVEKQSRTGTMPVGSFASPIERSFFRRLVQPIPPVTDNTNVNVVALGDERVAMTEAPSQWILDPETLAVKSRVAYDDELGSLPMIAHPHFDFERNEVVNAATEIGFSNALVVYAHGPKERKRRLVGKVKVGRIPYVHAFGLTPKHAVLIGHPLDVNPLSVLWSNRGFIDHFRFRPEAGTTLWLLDRETGQSRAHVAPAGFVFHVVNAFEDGLDTVLDVALHPDASIIDALRRPALETHGLPALAPSIVRYRMSPGKEHAMVETLLAGGFEFPSVSYRKKNGQRHAVAFGARIEAGGASTIMRLDERGHVLRHHEPGMTFGEPVFVAEPGASEEDAGVLLTVGSHAQRDHAELRVLDARTLDVLAQASVELPIPLGFHGSFFRAG